MGLSYCPLTSTQGLNSFELSKFYDLYHDLLDFSLAYLKQLFSNYFQNNMFHYFSYFPALLTEHRMDASIYILTGIKASFLTCVLFFQLLIFLSFYSQKVHCLNPLLSVTHKLQNLI